MSCNINKDNVDYGSVQHNDLYDTTNKDLPIRDTYFNEEISIQPSSNYSFSWKRLWKFTGPGFLMSIAYLDPGNIESDLRSGTIARYGLLWILVWSTFLGLLMQRLSARLGTVTGQHLAELCYRRYPKYIRILLWIMIEIAIIGSDMQEVIGTSVAIKLLSNGKISLYYGVLITICDTFTFLFLDKYGLRKLEAFFGLLITTMALTFGYEFFKEKPSFLDISKGILIPWCCNKGALDQAIGIIGAIIMPHNLYLHSALVKSRKINRTKIHDIKDANRYVFIEALIALSVSLIINISVTSVFAQGLYHVTYKDIRTSCTNLFIKNDTFPNTDDYVSPDLYEAGIILGCFFGLPALYIWALGIFAAGQSSTMTGTYSGQFVMEGFLDLRWSRWKRVLLTRSIAIAPTLLVAIKQESSLNSKEGLSEMNDMLNALMSIQLPFALIPTLTFTSSEKVMGYFKNGKLNIVVASLLSVMVISINIYYFIVKTMPSRWWTILISFLLVIYYILFVAYLVCCFLVAIGVSWLTNIPKIGKYFEEKHTLEHQHNLE